MTNISGAAFKAPALRGALVDVIYQGQVITKDPATKAVAEVDKVTASAADTVVVTLKSAVNAVSLAAAAAAITEKDAAALEIKGAKLSEDGKTLTLTTAAQVEGKTYVLDLGGKKTEFAAFTAVTLKVSAVKSLAQQKLQVTLSEAATQAVVDAAKAGITVKSNKDATKEIKVSGATLLADGKTVIIALADKTTAAEKYDVAIAGGTYSVVGLGEDAVVPTVTTVTSVANTKVKVVFTDAETGIDAATATNVANYTIPGLTVSKAEVTGNEVILTTSEQSQVVYTLTVANVKDNAGNNVSATANSKAFSGLAKDTTAPTVSAVIDASGKKIILTFNETQLLDAATVADLANYSIVGLDSSAVSKGHAPKVLSATIKADTNVYGGTPVVELAIEATKQYGVYTVGVKNIKDVAGNKLADYTTTVVGQQNTAPLTWSISDANNTNTTIKVTYGYTADKVTAETIANYTLVNANTGAVVSIKSAVLDVDGKTLVLTTAPLKTAADGAATPVYKLTVQNVVDTDGNKLAANADASVITRTLVGKDIDATAPTLSTATATDTNQVKVKFSESLDKATAEQATNYFIEGLGYATKAVLDAADTTNSTVLLTTLAQARNPYTVVVNGVKDASGNAIAANAKLGFQGLGNPFAAVTLNYALAENKNVIRVVFDQVLGAVVDKTKFTVKKEGGATLTVATATIVNDKEVLLTVNENLENAAYSVVVAKGAVTSKYGNVLSADTLSTNFGGVTADKKQITVASGIVVVDYNTVKLMLTDEVAVGGLTAANFKLYRDAAKTDAIAISSVDVAGKEVTIKTAAPLVKDNVQPLVYAFVTSQAVTPVRTELYALTVTNAVDSGLGVAAVPFKTAPELSIVSATMKDVNTLVVKYSNVLDDTMTMPANIDLVNNDKATETVNLAAAKAITSGDTVTYYFPADAQITVGETWKVVTKAGAVSYKYDPAVKIAAAKTVLFAATATTNAAPVLSSATLVGNYTLELQFSESLLAAPVVKVTANDLDSDASNDVVVATQAAAGSANVWTVDLADITKKYDNKAGYKVVVTSAASESGIGTDVIDTTATSTTNWKNFAAVKSN